MGPVVPQAHLLGTLSALDAWARRNRLASSRQEFAPITPIPFEPVRAAGWDVHHDLTLVVDFSHGSVEESWRGTHGCAADPAWSGRPGVVVRPSTRDEVTTWLPACFDEAYGARGLPSPYDRSVGELVVG